VEKKARRAGSMKTRPPFGTGKLGLSRGKKEGTTDRYGPLLRDTVFFSDSTRQFASSMKRGRRGKKGCHQKEMKTNCDPGRSTFSA